MKPVIFAEEFNGAVIYKRDGVYYASFYDARDQYRSFFAPASAAIWQLADRAKAGEPDALRAHICGWAGRVAGSACPNCGGVL